ncbi:lytic transglycosylase domain-containing protein [Caloramator sp. E03]|uniref:lytic transglycosylase domain-containing protein n=1 Tax=Caloramator sp. E03 TaxID=2576307 RepID=UPI00143D09E3|nr:lytic transglycosylase domain-containing protein [Caloramator sp. E03]
MKTEEIAKIMQIYMMQSAYIGSTDSSNDVSGMFSVILKNLLDKINSEVVENESKSSLGESDSNNKNINKNIFEAIKQASEKYNVEEDLIKAVIDVESSFNPLAVSSSGAQGLMQLMPSTQKMLGIQNPFDVLDNIEGGTRYLKTLLDAFSGNKELALAAYNGGIWRMKRLGVDTVDEIDKMPKETQDYVRKVMKEYKKY